MVLHNLNINCNLILFCDDTSVSISEPSNKTICTILNLHEWFTNNRLIFNIDKTKCYLIKIHILLIVYQLIQLKYSKYQVILFLELF